MPVTQKALLMSVVFAERVNGYLIPKSHLGPQYTWEKVSAKQTYPL